MALEIDSNSAEGEESPAVNEAEAVRRMLGKKVPEIVDPAAVLDDKSSTVEEREQALEEIADWFVVECGGPKERDIRLVPAVVQYMTERQR